MPVYSYRCDECQSEVDMVSSIENRDNPRLHCGKPMKRLLSIPLVLMKQTGRGMALDALNSKETSHMKPEMKQMAARGL